MRVVLADLGQSQVTQSSEFYPSWIPKLATYSQPYAALKEPFDIWRSLIPESADVPIDEELSA